MKKQKAEPKSIYHPYTEEVFCQLDYLSYHFDMTLEQAQKVWEGLGKVDPKTLSHDQIVDKMKELYDKGELGAYVYYLV